MVRHRSELHHDHEVPDIETLRHGFELVAHRRRAADDDEFVSDHVLGFERLELDRQIGELQKILPALEHIQEALVVAIAGRRGNRC